MRLNDFQPHWIGINASPDRGLRIGLSFLCPHCQQIRLTVYFKPQINPNHTIFPDWPVERSMTNVLWWDRISGDTFDDLSLAPSIDYSGSHHWHGSIVNGECITSVPT